MQRVHRKNVRPVVILGFLVAALAAPATVAQSQSRPLVTVQFANVGLESTYYSPFIFAEKKGFYEQEGIRNETPRLSDPDIVRAVASGAVSIGIPEAGAAMTAIEKGADIRVVAGVTDRYPYDLMVKKQYRSIADLKGKTLSIWSTAPGVALTLMKRVLTSGGLKEGDYSIIAGGNSTARYAALVAGQIDGTIVTTPQNSLAKKAGYPSLGQLHSIPALFAAVIVNRSWAEKNDKLLTAWLRATMRGFRYIASDRNEAEVVRTLATDFKADPEIIASDYKLLYRDETYIVSWDLLPSPRSMQGTIDILAEINLVAKGSPLSKFYDLKYVNQARRDIGQ